MNEGVPVVTDGKIGGVSVCVAVMVGPTVDCGMMSNSFGAVFHV